MPKIDKIIGRSVLDSRGRPTVEVEVYFENLIAMAISPSGASTGKFEAHELRDNDKRKYHGASVDNAVNFVNMEIANLLKTLDFTDQKLIDEELCKLDGTKNKERLGANAILACSLAIAKLSALYNKKPLYLYVNELLDRQNITPSLPIPFVNIINGGCHANNNLDIQEFMIVPVMYGCEFKDRIRACSEVFHSLKSILKERNLSTNVGDEGGFAPELSNNEEGLKLLSDAVKKAGYEIGEDFAFGLDVAASSFYDEEKKIYKIDGGEMNYQQLNDYLIFLGKKYPIISIEDGLAETDFDGWKYFTEQFGQYVQLIGDDLFVTNKELLQKGIDNKYANSILIKPNQIGTLTETLDTIRLAIDNNYRYMISHRSGETEDTTIAHIAVGTGAGQIKTGSVCRGERTAKYNELIRIEERLMCVND
jgi:enolase